MCSQVFKITVKIKFKNMQKYLTFFEQNDNIGVRKRYIEKGGNVMTIKTKYHGNITCTKEIAKDLALVFCFSNGFGDSRKGLHRCQEVSG